MFTPEELENKYGPVLLLPLEVEQKSLERFMEENHETLLGYRHVNYYLLEPRNMDSLIGVLVNSGWKASPGLCMPDCAFISISRPKR
jgi:hypothetical protein